LLLAVMVVFAQTRRFGFIEGDEVALGLADAVDDQKLVRNEARVVAPMVRLIASEPILRSAHRAEMRRFGRQPAGYHLVSMAIHIASALLLFLLVCHMTRSRALAGGAVWRSGFAAALFAVHPWASSPVAWVSAQGDLLSTLFALLMIWAYALYVERPTWQRYSLVMLCLVSGLLCSVSLVTVPVVLLLLDFWPLQRLHSEAVDIAQRRRAMGMLLMEKLPFVAICAVVGAAVLRTFGLAGLAAVQESNVRAAEWVLTTAHEVAMFCWPWSQTPFYAPLGGAISSGQVVAAGSLLVFVSLATIWQWRHRPYLATGWFWFLVMLAPSVIWAGQSDSLQSAEQCRCFAGIGLAIIASWGGAELVSRLRMAPIGAATGAAGLLLALTVSCHSQVSAWSNNVTLAEHALQVDPHSYRAHDFKGDMLVKQGQYAGATREYRLALDEMPAGSVPHVQLQMAVALGELGEFTEAEDFCHRAADAHPRLAVVNCTLAELLLRQRRWHEAENSCQEAIAADPQCAQAYCDLALAYLELDRFDGAVRYGRRAVKLAPEVAKYQANLGVILLRSGRVDQAQTACEEATRIEPFAAKTWYNLGLVQGRRGLIREAAISLARAAELDPQAADSWLHLGKMQALQGQLDAAANSLQKAAQIVPTSAEAHLDLGWVRHHQSRPAEAIAEYREARRLRPAWSEPTARLAWILATCPWNDVRRPAEAVKLAEEAARSDTTLTTGTLDTLAAAYATAGRYGLAAHTIRRALDQLSPDDPIVPALSARWDLYTAGQPYRETIVPGGNPK
jgi:tetratricopeptide (TPR) repeat protein